MNLVFRILCSVCIYLGFDFSDAFRYYLSMAFVRTVKRPHTPNIGVQIVESRRDDKGRPRQRIIRNMGSAAPGEALEALVHVAKIELDKLKNQEQLALFPAEQMAEMIMEARSGRQKYDKPFPIADARLLKEEKRLVMGFHEVFGTFYRQMGFNRLWGARHRMSARLFRQAVLMRLADHEGSKLSHCRKLSKDHGVEQSVDKIYRMMDRLDDERIGRLREIVSGEVRSLVDGKIEVVFFDVTTISFASEQEDELRRKGWSKDGKPHRVQVVLALFQTAQGLPVGYRLFPGNTADVSTLEPAIGQLREELDIGRVVIVADGAMGSAKNLETLADMGHDWVVAARIRGLKKKHLERLWKYADTTRTKEDKQFGELEVEGRRLVVSWCPKRARKDAADRERAVDKARERISQTLKGNGRRARFIKVDRDGVSVNEEAILRDEKFDGLHGVWTSLGKEHTPRGVYEHYGELWRIEESFRVMKHSMSVRPVFHWTERRVRAHVAICYAAFSLLRIYRWRFNMSHPEQPPLSEERILSELRDVQASLLLDQNNGMQYLLSSTSNQVQRFLYGAVGAKLCRETVPLFAPADM